MVRGAFPVWAGSLILVRDAVILIAGGLRACSAAACGIDVRYIGKVATFCLMVAVPAISWGTLGYPLAARRAGHAAGSPSVWASSSTTSRPVSTPCDIRRALASRENEVAERVSFVPSLFGRTAVGRPGREDRWSSRTIFATRRTTSGRGSRAAGSASGSPTSRKTLSATSSTWICRRSAPGRGRSGVRRGGIDEVGLRRLQPLSGTIVERNPLIDEHPELVNEQPYGDGWLIVDRAQRRRSAGRSDGRCGLSLVHYRDLTPCIIGRA